jgi:nitrogen fixation NifU-like protein
LFDHDRVGNHYDPISDAMEKQNIPDNMRRMNDPDGSALVKGLCGDIMEMYLVVEDGRIARSSFHTDGCSSSIACGSAAARLADGRSIDEALRLSPADVIDVVGDLPLDSAHCAILAIMTLHKALADYLLRHSQG